MLKCLTLLCSLRTSKLFFLALLPLAETHLLFFFVFFVGFQGFMVVERASVYGSRNMLDQHRDMRMDVDNMSYEVFINLLVFLALQLILCTQIF